MPTITLSRVSKSYVSGQLAVRDLDLEIPAGAFMCLLGPSGCGKTTTLRMIAGLEQATGGEIRIGDTVLDAVDRGRFVPTERREMGFVFQSYALWPHLTVRRNVDFGLRLRHVPRAERDRRSTEALTMMQIEHLGDRYPAQLSGGQQQRVSLARMLAVNPEVLLLDEPLSNLDARLRLEMRAELKQLHATTGHTFVFVTHDQLEAMTMATHVAVMSDGVLQQVGPPLEVYNRPANTFVARFVGSPPMNLIRLADEGDSALVAALRGGIGTLAPAVRADVTQVGIRPEAIHLLPRSGTVPDGALALPTAVSTVLPTGSTWVVSLDRGATTRTARDDDAAADDAGAGELYAVAYQDTGLGTGQPVTAWVNPSDLHLFDERGSRLADWDDAVQRTTSGPGHPPESDRSHPAEARVGGGQA